MVPTSAPEQEEKDKLVSPTQEENPESWYKKESPKAKKAGSGEEQSLHKLADIPNSARGIVGFAKTNRGKIFIGGAAAGLITLLIVGFFALLPFKILHIFNNLQSHFFSSSENAVQKETDALFSTYIKKYVIPGLNDCRGSVIDRTCTPRSIAGDTLFNKLFNGWRTVRLEEKLATQYGLEFYFNKNNGSVFLKDRAAPGAGVSLKGFENSTDGLDDFLKKSNHGQIRQAVRERFASETRWKRVMYHYKVGRLLAKKYGIVRCNFVCEKLGLEGLANTWGEWRNSHRNSFKLFLTQRVLVPRTEMIGVVMACLFDPSCNPNANNNTPVETDAGGKCISECSEHGAEISDVERYDFRESVLYKLSAQYGKLGLTKESIDEMNKVWGDMNKKGLLAYAVDSAYTKLIEKATGDGEKRTQGAPSAASDAIRNALSKIGAAWWISEFINGVNKVPDKLQKLNYVMNTTSMATTFTMMRTSADELKEGSSAIDAQVLGDFTDGLSTTDADLTLGDRKGGTAEAENSPLYQYILGNPQIDSSTSPVFSWLNGNALAATVSGDLPGQYLCNDGKPVPAGQLVCPEEKLGQIGWIGQGIRTLQGNALWQTLSQVAALFGKLTSALTAVINAVCDILGPVCPAFAGLMGALINAIARIPGFEQLFKYLQSVFMNFLMPDQQTNPFSSNMSGGRTFHMAAGGADVGGNDFAHHGLGGRVLSSSELLTIQNEQKRQELESYKNKSFFARMFDTDSDYSPTVKLAMAVPTNMNELSDRTASLFTNPFRSFDALFSSAQALNATMAQDPFNVTQYGYSGPVIIHSGDPKNPGPMDGQDFWKVDQEQFWNYYCVSTSPYYITNTWNKESAKALNPQTLNPENYSTNPCLLIESSIGSTGAIYNSDVLTPDDLAGGSSTGAPAGGSTTTPTGGGIGTTTNGFTFPLMTTQAVVKSGSSGSVWCYTSLTSCHHDYNAADIFVPTGTQVISPANCLVTTVHDTIDPQWASAEGSRVSLKCNDGRTYYMAHMGRGTLAVREGQTISAGTPIGKVGTAADAEGTVSHLHIDALPANQYDRRPGCGDAACNAYPFINIQPDLVKAFASLP